MPRFASRPTPMASGMEAFLVSTMVRRPRGNRRQDANLVPDARRAFPATGADHLRNPFSCTSRWQTSDAAELSVGLDGSSGDDLSAVSSWPPGQSRRITWPALFLNPANIIRDRVMRATGVGFMGCPQDGGPGQHYRPIAGRELERHGPCSAAWVAGAGGRGSTRHGVL